MVNVAVSGLSCSKCATIANGTAAIVAANKIAEDTWTCPLVKLKGIRPGITRVHTTYCSITQGVDTIGLCQTAWLSRALGPDVLRTLPGLRLPLPTLQPGSSSPQSFTTYALPRTI